MNTIRVVLADKHHLIRRTIRLLLEKSSDIELIGEASNGQEAMTLVQNLVPEVLILDVDMPLLNGIHVVEQIALQHIPTRVVMLSAHDDQTLVRRALQQGVTSYLIKRYISKELLLAVRAASHDETFLSPAISKIVLDTFLSAHEDASCG